MDLVIESYSEDPLAQVAATAGSQALLEWAWHNLHCGVSILQREGRSGSAMRTWPQPPRDRCSGLDFEQDWTDHRPISRSSVKPGDARDCIMNESWQELREVEIHAQDQVDFRTVYGSCERQTDVSTRPAQFRQADTQKLALKPLNSPSWIFYICLNWFSPRLTFEMATPESLQFVQFTFPPLKPPFYKSSPP